MQKKQRKQGKLIVIEGNDGVGKATQTRLLIAHLRKNKYPVTLVDFPRYGKKSAALVEEYLNGKFGGIKDVGPYPCSILYAVDRYAASGAIRQALSQGHIVVANRYASTNMGHQGAKIKNRQARIRFFRWLDHLEYKIFDIPRPDLTIILHIPANIAQKLVGNKGHRAYIGKKKFDIHESNLRYLKTVGTIYMEIAKTIPKMKLVSCIERGRLLTPAEVHEKIWEITSKTL